MMIDRKQCSGCGLDLPLERFRRRRTGRPERHSECDACHLAYQKRRRQHLRQREISEHIRRVNLIQSKPSKTEAVTRAMIQRFGGFENLVADLMGWYQRAVEEQDLASQLRFFSLVARLIETSAQLNHQHDTGDLESLSDQQLDAAIRQEIRELIRQNPTLVLQATAEVEGRIVCPPNSDAETSD